MLDPRLDFCRMSLATLARVVIRNLLGREGALARLAVIVTAVSIVGVSNADEGGASSRKPTDARTQLLSAVLHSPAGTEPAGVTVEFSSVETVRELDRMLAAAKAHGRPALLDFTAKWCAPCKRMERTTFTDPAVRAALAQFVLLRADVTMNTHEDEALLKRFNAQGPPVIAFFDAKGWELKTCQINGFMAAGEFRRRLDACRKG